MTIMRLQVKFIGFPDLKRMIGSNEVSVEMEGNTFGDLLRDLERTYGSPTMREFMEEKGVVDESVQILRNGREWIHREDMSFPFSDGDHLTFLLMMAGG